MLKLVRTLWSDLRTKRMQNLYSMVLLVSEPFHQDENIHAHAAARAFGVPFDGSDEMHCVLQTPDFFLIKAGELLITIRPKWGAYLAKNSEDDVETGAALLPNEQRAWWRRQKAWIALDIRNQDLPQSKALGVLAKLLLELVDDRSCGVWIPNIGTFLPNDGTAIGELRSISRQ